MRSTSRKLLLSLSTFIFALVTLFGATFAWFTTADTATVDTLTFNVSTGANLMISTTEVALPADGTYASVVTSAQIASMYGTQHTSGGKLFTGVQYALSNLRMTPLTSTTGNTFYVEQKAGTEYYAAGYQYAPGAAGVFYFDIVLTFRAAAPMNVHLAYDASLPLITSTVSSTERGGAYRMAFLVGAATTPVMIYEKDAPDTKTNSLIRGGNFHTQPSWTDAPVQTTTGALENGVPGNNRTNSLIMTLNPGAETYAYETVTIRLWLEGWDLLTIDALKSSTMAVNLKFIGLTI
jgi:hypothetical protein